MIKLYFPSIFSFLLLTGSMLATGQTLQWQKALGGTNYDYTVAVEQAHDSGYVVCGYSLSTDGDATGTHGSSDMWVTKLSNSGSTVWRRLLGGSGSDDGYAIKPTADGGYIVGGSSRSTDGDVSVNQGLSDAWLVKLDATGNLQWQKTYGGSADERINAVQQTVDGGYILAGFTRSSDGDITNFHGGTAPDCWVIKTDNSGNVLWQKTYGGTGDDEAVAIVQTSDGGYIFTGLTMSSNGDITNYHGGTSDGGDCWVVKLDKNGNIKWQKTYGGTLEEQGFSIIEKANGNYLLGASTESSNGDVTGHLGQADAWILELDGDGGIIWQKSIGTTQAEYLTDMRRTADGGLAFGGWNGNFWLVKTDSLANVVWQANFGGTTSDGSWGMALGNDGGYVLTGATSSNNTGDVTGYHGGGEDAWVIKVSNPVSVAAVHQLQDISVYPNPASSELYIDGVKDDNTTATIFDLLGQIIAIHTLNRGEQKIALDDLAAGTYMLVLSDSNAAHRKVRFAVIK